MSTTPETARADDEIVSLLSRWLASHLTNADLRERLCEIGTAELSSEQAEAVSELLAELDRVSDVQHGDLEMIVRETLEAVALG